MSIGALDDKNGKPDFIGRVADALKVVNQGGKVYAVTPADGSDLPNGPCVALWVGGAGNITLVAEKNAINEAVTFNSVPAGVLLPVRTRRVEATGTTATNILAIYP